MDASISNRSNHISRKAGGLNHSIGDKGEKNGN